jgi:plastocyanin
MQRFVVLCGVIIFLWTAGMFSVYRSAAMAVTHTVAIDGVTFDPATLTVKVGDTVVTNGVSLISSIPSTS